MIALHQLTGAVIASNITVNGAPNANIVSTNSTVNLFNSGSSTLNIGGGASTISLGATSGTTTVNTDLTLGSGKKLTTTGPVSFNPGSGNNVAITTGASSFLAVSGLQASTGTPICVDGSNHVVTCTASATLQSAYNNGNTITTTSSKDISFNLANNSNFSVTTAAGATGNSMFSEAAGAGSTVPNQLILVDNAGVLGVDNAIPTAIKVTSSGGAGFTTGIDVSAALTTGIALGTSGISGTYFNVDTAGNTSMNGTLTVNGGTIGTTVSSSTINLFNTNATTVNLGGAATTIAMGATTGTATINNAIVNFPHATTIGASNAAGNFKSLTTGGGYSSTGATIDNNGNIQAKGTLTIDSTSTLTGAVTANGNLTVNGSPNANIVSTNSTVNLFNSGSSTLNIGGGASTISLGATSGTTTVNNNLTITGTLTGNGQTNLTPANNNNVAITLGGTSNFSITGLSGAAGTSLCLDSSNRVATCNAGSSAATLQSAYNTGNTITTGNSKDITFSLAGSSSNFAVQTPAGATSYSAFTRGSGAGSSDPSQLVLIQNLQTRALPIGLKVAGVSSGVVTTAIDLSDQYITNALALGAGNITATHFSLTGSSGNLSTDGTLAVNGGTISTNQSTFNLVNDATATTVNFAEGATTLTMGATSGTTSIRNATLSLPNATAINATSATVNSYAESIGGGYGSTGVTIDTNGNIFANGLLTVDNSSLLSGPATAAAGFKVSGTLSGDIYTDKATGTLFNTTATTVNIGGAATTISIGATTGTTTINNALTINGTLTANGTANIGNGSNPINLYGTNIDIKAASGANTITNEINDNLLNAFDIKQGSNDYFNITTTNGSRSMSFGNVNTNPIYNFNGSGTMTLTGSLVVNGGNVSANAGGNSVNLFNTNQTTSLTIGGYATTVAIGASTGTTTVTNNLTVSGATTSLASTAINLTGANPILDLSGTGTLSINSTTGRDLTLGKSATTANLTINETSVNLAGTTPTIAASIGNNTLTVNAAGSGDLNLEAAGTGNVNLAGGVNSTGCTITNSTGAISCTGAFTTTNGGATSGTVQFGYFTRDFNTGIISNSTAGDTLSISTTSTAYPALTLTTSALQTPGTSGFKNNVYITGSGTTPTYYGQQLVVNNNQTVNPDTVYGQYITFADTGNLANTIYGLYVDANTPSNGSDTQYAAAFMNGNVGIGTNTPGGALEISQSAGTALKISGNFGAGGTGLAITANPVTTGKGIDLTAASLTSGTGINLGGTSPTNPTAFTGNMISIAPTRTISSGTSSINDTGNYLNIARNNNVNVANTFTISGDLVKLLSGCTVSNGGVCTDTSHMFSLYQTLASASGSLLYINNVSKGLALDINSMGYTNPVASISGTTSYATLVANNNGVGDLFTASASGWTRFEINNNGDLLPGRTNMQNIGSSTLQWNNVYAGNYYQNGTLLNVTNYWNRTALGNIFPATANDTIAATSSAWTPATFTTNNGSGTLANNTLIQNTGAGNVTNLLNLTQSGGGTVTNGINITRSAGTLTTGINLSGTIGTDISLQNAETISNSTDNTINLGFGAASGILQITSATSGNINFSAGGNIDAAAALNLGTSTQTGLTLGRAGANTTINGANTGAGLTIGPTTWTATPTISGLITATLGLTSNSTLTVAANQNLTMTAGSGVFSQGYTSNTNNNSAHTLSFTNSATSGTVAINGFSITPNGTATSGTNTLNGILFNTPGTPNSNTFNAINFGTGYNNLITSANFSVTAAGLGTFASIADSGLSANSAVYTNGSNPAQLTTTAPITGVIGYWNRTALGNIFPATANDTIAATSSAWTPATFTTNNPSGTITNGLLVQNTGAGTVTNAIKINKGAGAGAYTYDLSLQNGDTIANTVCQYTGYFCSELDRYSDHFRIGYGNFRILYPCKSCLHRNKSVNHQYGGKHSYN